MASVLGEFAVFTVPGAPVSSPQVRWYSTPKPTHPSPYSGARQLALGSLCARIGKWHVSGFIGIRFPLDISAAKGVDSAGVGDVAPDPWF